MKTSYVIKINKVYIVRNIMSCNMRYVFTAQKCTFVEIYTLLSTFCFWSIEFNAALGK